MQTAQTSASATVSQVIDLDLETHKYDLPVLQDFLDRVFHTPVGTPLVWYARGRPGYPRTVEDMFKVLGRSPAPSRPLYFGTSSVRPMSDGTLYNRKSQFAALHVVVLDDIGTKVPLEAIPEALREPSYVIETSPGNFQWGYILREPVERLEAAAELVRTLYASGVTDPGGAVATKLVRLPDGVNGKPIEGRAMFHVELRAVTERLWTPQELLEAIEADVTWSELLEGATEPLKRRPRSLLPWSPLQMEAPTGTGVVDPVLEWLYQTGQVVSDSGNWVTIECPWGAAHTDGSTLSGYMPLGRGDYPDHRGWSCFHAHCAERNTATFLSRVATDGGPGVAIYDPSSPLVGRWVYDPADELCYEVLHQASTADAPSLEGVTLSALRNIYREKIPITQHDGTARLQSVVEAWLNHPCTVHVFGTINAPQTTAPLVPYDGRLRINSFRRPAWEGTAYEEDCAIWEKWLDYLIPNQEERDYFCDWLAAKFQDPAFRGCGILMVTEAFGTGRGTLAKMITRLFGRWNVTSPSWPVLVGTNPHNEWQESLIAITNETLDGVRGTDVFRAYESLKTVIETAPTDALINPKHKRARSQPVYTSHLLFSNHELAIVLPEHDRRLFCISNPDRPAAPDFFTKIYAWLDTDWECSVADWLRERPVDVSKLLAPPPMTDTKRNMIQGAFSDGESVLHELVKKLRSKYIAPRYLRDVLAPYRTRLRIDGPNGARHLTHAIARISMTTHYRPSVFGRQVRARRLRTVPEEETTSEEVAQDIEQHTVEELQKWVGDILDSL